MALLLEIVTPEKKVFSETVDGVVLPGAVGELGVLEQHIPLVSILEPGELQYRRGDQVEELAVGEGFIEITAQRVAVLTDMALGVGEIDEEATERAIERARNALQEKTSEEEIAAVQASLRKSLAQLELKRKRRQV